MKTEMPAAHFVNLSLPETEVLIARALPILKSVLTPEQWWTLIRDFFAMYYCCEPALHKVAEEVLDYLDGEHRGGKPGFPGFLLDLVHYEWVGLALTAAGLPPMPAVDAEGDLMQGAPVAAPMLRVDAYDYPVHRIRPDNAVDLPSPVHLAVYLDPDASLCRVEIEASAARLLEQFEAGAVRTGRDLQADRVLLESLRRRGLIVGVLRDADPVFQRAGSSGVAAARGSRGRN